MAPPPKLILAPGPQLETIWLLAFILIEHMQIRYAQRDKARLFYLLDYVTRRSKNWDFKINK